MGVGSIICLSLVGLLILFKIYNVVKAKKCHSKLCLAGKTVIVTGANSGIGYETALEFAKRGARVILACRDLIKAEQAKNKIISLTENNNVVVKKLDLSSLQSVKNFAKDINKNEDKLNILVNNAGSGILRSKYTQDGLEVLMQINYFGPFLLTILLIDLLKKSGPSRIINVSSYLAKKSNLTVDRLNKLNTALAIYGNSKLGNILFTMKLAKLLKNSNVTVYSLHPGTIATNIFRRLSGYPKYILKCAMFLYFKTSEEGSQTTLHTALEQGIEKYSGGHFEECALVPTYEKAKDPDFADKIWNKTVEILKLENEVAQCFSSS